MTHFHLTLPSNASMRCYPNNTAAQFTTKLPSTVELDGDWEVGLTEISCPGSRYNIRRDEYRFEVMQDSPSMNAKFAIPEGYYGNMFKIIRSLMQIQTSRLVEFTFNDECGRVEFKVADGHVLKMNRAMQDLMGFDDLLYRSGRSHRAERDHSIPVDIQTMYVYCDVLQSVLVGDTKAPLLRIVNVEEKTVRNFHRVMNPIFYVPLQKRQFDTIEINVMDDTGRAVSFTDGKTIVVLEFRRIIHPYFAVNK